MVKYSPIYSSPLVRLLSVAHIDARYVRQYAGQLPMGPRFYDGIMAETLRYFWKVGLYS